MRHYLFFFCLILFYACEKDTTNLKTELEVIEVADSINFAIIGDYGKEGPVAYDVSELVKSWNPDFVITLGDNNYETGTLNSVTKNIAQYYCDFIYNPDAPEAYQCAGRANVEQRNRFFPCLGNHDQYNDEASRPYETFFTLPGKEVYYNFRWGPVEFFALNSGVDGEAACCETEQAIWLQDVLNQSTADFKVVYFHHSPYSTSHHGNNEYMQWPFKNWGADIVLTGHSHLYEKISLIADPDFHYLVNGLGGNPNKHNCDENPLPTTRFNHFCFNEDFGAIKAIANGESLIFQFIGINNPEEIIDELILN